MLKFLREVALQVTSSLTSNAILWAISLVFVFFAAGILYLSTSKTKVAVVIVKEGNDVDDELLMHIRSKMESKVAACKGFLIADWYSYANISQVEKLAEGLNISNSALFDSEQALEIGKLVQA